MIRDTQKCQQYPQRSISINITDTVSVSQNTEWYIKFDTFLNDRSDATFQDAVLSVTVFDTSSWELVLVVQIILHYIC